MAIAAQQPVGTDSWKPFRLGLWSICCRLTGTLDLRINQRTKRHHFRKQHDRIKRQQG